MAQTFDVAVIGGGVMGCGIAWKLAERGHKVVVLERDRVGAKASSAAAGMLGAQAELTEDGPLLRLAVKSRSMFPGLAAELKELSGIDIRFVDRGMVKIALTAEEAEALRDQALRHCEMGLEVAWLDGERLRQRVPGLSPLVQGGVFLPRDGQVSAPDFTRALARSAVKRGAIIREHVEVTGLVLDGNAVRGVKTLTDVIHADRVVVAAGAWTGGMLAKAGVHIPTVPVKGECFSVMADTTFLGHTVFAEGCYLVPKEGGRLVVGATMEPGTFDERISLGGLAELMQKAMRIFPSIHLASWERAWSGIRPQTPDGLPILGRHPEIGGLIVATGHFRNGILLAPVTAEIAADLAEDKPVPPSLEAFRVDRWNNVEVMS
ncbi:glycine oxidase ThiO [Staphylospora marina]|uniref:glycine oxidase ThiO n=1 Tax=Staphylospora marina TaxID=2490858 RepID=UPI000F5BC887|nr:glycine oxidase ThiO [Staphylospora marina]